jgi:protein O-mannosyl-transferase
MSSATTRRWVEEIIPPLCAAVVFGRSVAFPLVGYDDPLHVTNNPLVTNPGSLGIGAQLSTPALGYPAPLLVLSWAADHALFGINPVELHAVNVALHAVAAWLVVRLARGLGAVGRAPLLAGLLFAVHPIVTEPVCWITGRKDLLATTLLLGALVAAVRGGERRWLVTVPLGVAAMLAKPTAVVAPLLVWIVAGLGPRRRQGAIALGMLGTAAAGVAAAGLIGERRLGTLVDRTLGEALLDTVGAWTLQAQHLVWPVGMVPSYSRWDDDPSPLAMGIVTACIALAIAAAWRFAPRGGPVRRGLAFAAIAYLPVSGALGRVRWTADSYLYLPLVGIVISAAVALAPWLERVPARVRTLSSAALPAGLAVLALAQTTVWQTPDAVWRAVRERYPENPVATSELAATLAFMGRSEEAQAEYLVMDQRFPDFDGVYLPRAEARLATGDAIRALQLLASGMRAGDHRCISAYWQGLLPDLGARARPPREDLELAFRLGLPSAESALGDPRACIRLAGVFDRAGDASAALRCREIARTK